MAEVSSTEYQKHNVIEIDKIKTVYEDGEILYADNMNEVVDKENEIIDKLKGVSEDLSELETYVMNAYAYTKGWVGDIYTYFDTAYSYFTTAYISNRDRIEALEAKEVEVDPEHNSFKIKDPDSEETAKYTLNIVNGLLGLFKYVASAWGTCGINTRTNSTGTGSYSNVEYDYSYSAISVTNYPFRNVSCKINHGTTNILLTGVQIRHTNSSYSYIYGGEATIENGIVTYVGDDKKSLSDYTNSDIDTNIAISSNLPSQTNATKPAGNATSTFSVGTNVNNQYAVLYYHENGQNNLHVNRVSAQSTGKWEITSIQKGFFTRVGKTFNKPTGLGQYTGLGFIVGAKSGTLMSFTATTQGEYGWMAIPASLLTDGSLPTITQYDEAGNKGADGGWEESISDGFTFYSDKTRYRTFKTINPLTQKVYYKITSK